VLLENGAVDKMIKRMAFGILNGAKYGLLAGLVIWLGSGLIWTVSGGGMIREVFTYTTFFVVYAAAIGATIGGLAWGRLGIWRGLIFGGLFLPLAGCIGSLIFLIIVEVVIYRPPAWLGWLPFLWLQFGPIIGAIIGAIIGGLSRIIKTSNNIKGELIL
jgi:hypothetical protein